MKQTTAGGPVIYILLLLLSLLWVRPAASQSAQVGNVDEALEQAQSLAYSGQYDQARELARAILAEAPDYLDVRILIARTYAWEERQLLQGPSSIDLMQSRFGGLEFYKALSNSVQ